MLNEIRVRFVESQKHTKTIAGCCQGTGFPLASLLLVPIREVKGVQGKDQLIPWIVPV